MLNLNNPDLLRQQNFVCGHWVGVGKNPIDVYNPYSGDLVGQVPSITQDQLRETIAHAKTAQKEWATRPAIERSDILMRWYHLLLENKEDLAHIMTSEQGKTLGEARIEIDFSASFIRWFAEEARRTYGDIIPSPTLDKRLMVIKQPVGVTAAITPWNFPAGMLARKAGPALACGCAMVIKPASETPFSAIAMTYLAQVAGVPDGVLSVVTGKAGDIAQEIMTNSTVKKVSFTGSTEVGKILMNQSGATVKKLSLELGGNAPFIVFDDANVDDAVAGLVGGKVRNCGQTCVTPNRIYVQSGIYDTFVEKFCTAIENLPVGNGLAQDTAIGPLVSDKAATTVQDLLDDAITKGATVALAGGRVGDSNLFKPVVLTNVTSDMNCVTHEIFGPLAPIISFDTVDEAIAKANDTQFGLAGYFYTQDLNKLFAISEQLECGLVGLNTVAISTTEAPFGGWKESGIGVEGSKAGIDEYMVKKYICLGGV